MVTTRSAVDRPTMTLIGEPEFGLRQYDAVHEWALEQLSEDVQAVN